MKCEICGKEMESEIRFIYRHPYTIWRCKDCGFKCEESDLYKSTEKNTYYRKTT